MTQPSQQRVEQNPVSPTAEEESKDAVAENVSIDMEEPNASFSTRSSQRTRRTPTYLKKL